MNDYLNSLNDFSSAEAVNCLTLLEMQEAIDCLKTDKETSKGKTHILQIDGISTALLRDLGFLLVDISNGY
jgi:hypothetical protein